MYKLSDNYYEPVPQDLIEGETTPLRISQKYLDIAGNREPDIDWSFIPEMLKLVRQEYDLVWWREEAIGHLIDASNKSLDDVRRMHHFDHAGSRIWEGSNGGLRGRDLGALMSMFHRAGGK